MHRINNLLAWGAAAIVVAFAALNWTTLMAPAPLDLLIMQIQAPLGVVLLGLTAALVALFFIAYLGNQIGSLIETRKLLKEIQRVQDLADKSEASRLENIRQLIVTEFQLLNERLFRTEPPAQPKVVDSEFKPYSLTEVITGHERAA
jgi:hypothetical protein